MIPGVEIRLGGVDYVLPPLNLAGIKQLKTKLETVFSSGVPDMAVVCEAAYWALKRNYPDQVTMEMLESYIDYSNFIDIFDAVMNTSGLIEKVGKLTARFQATATPTALPSTLPTS